MNIRIMKYVIQNIKSKSTKRLPVRPRNPNISFFICFVLKIYSLLLIHLSNFPSTEMIKIVNMPHAFFESRVHFQKYSASLTVAWQAKYATTKN